jgi:hypothetical protein
VLAGVAKKMAGQFFAAVDAELRGVATPTHEEVQPDWTYGAYHDREVVHVGKTASPSFPPGTTVLVGGLVGATIALLGVLVGSKLGRRR